MSVLLCANGCRGSEHVVTQHIDASIAVLLARIEVDGNTLFQRRFFVAINISGILQR